MEEEVSPLEIVAMEEEISPAEEEVPPAEEEAIVAEEEAMPKAHKQGLIDDMPPMEDPSMRGPPEEIIEEESAMEAEPMIESPP